MCDVPWHFYFAFIRRSNLQAIHPAIHGSAPNIRWCTMLSAREYFRPARRSTTHKSRCFVLVPRNWCDCNWMQSKHGPRCIHDNGADFITLKREKQHYSIDYDCDADAATSGLIQMRVSNIIWRICVRKSSHPGWYSLLISPGLRVYEMARK